MTPSSNSPLRFNIIVAVDRDFGIGKNGGLPWHLPQDLKHFKDITTAASPNGQPNVVIMGRKTWESLPEKFRPLPQRLNIVLTRQSEYSLPSSVWRYPSLEAALSDLNTKTECFGRVFVIGGAKVFQEALVHPNCEILYLTHIENTFDCDTHCPIALANFKEIARLGPFADRELRFSFVNYQRI